MSYTNKVDWEIEPRRCALLIHDMQPHYLSALPPDIRNALVVRVGEVMDACLAREMPIFVSYASPAKRNCDRGLLLDLWGPGPSWSVEILHPALNRSPNAFYPLAKRSYSAFYGSDLEVNLRRHGRDGLIIAGVYTSIGCHYTAIDAFARDIRCFLLEDATADFSPDDHALGLRRSAYTCARIIGAKDILIARDK